jgi:Mn-dependent DtxR family transcriptional regulator
VDQWKDFEANGVSHSVSHHLAAIAQLTADQGYARAVDVARYLHITRGSVSLALKSLKERGLVEEDSNRFLLLSEQGRRIVERIGERRQVVRTFFVDVLGVNPKQADADACRIEHLLSDEVCRRLEKLLRTRGARRAKTKPTRPEV